MTGAAVLRAVRPLRTPSAFAVRAVARRFLFPGIILNTVIGNQLWMIGPVQMGQFIYWLTLIAAAIVVITAFGHQTWPYALLAALPAARVIAVAVPGAEFGYGAVANSLFLLAGVVAAIEEPLVLYRQVRLFLALCIPIMILQVAGAGLWTQALNTQYWTEEEGSRVVKQIFPALFVRFNDLQYTSQQGRPPGLLHSNAVLAFVILLGMALQFARAQSRRITRGDVIVCAAMVLAMAKVALAGFVVLLTWTAIRGDSTVRARARAILGLTVALYALYWLFFPGMLLYNISVDAFITSVGVRLVDIAVATSSDPAQREAARQLLSASLSYNYGAETDIGGLSGYPALIKATPFLAVATLVALRTLRRGWRYVRSVDPARNRAAELLLLALLIGPAGTPLFGASIYWYFAGIAAVPLALGMSPHMVNVLRDAETRRAMIPSDRQP
jgi:hypothetical protein